MKARIPFLLYFIFFHSSNTTTEHSASDAGGINDYIIRSANAKAGATATASSAALRQQFLNSDFTACPKTLPYAAPRREPETTVLEEGEDAGETGEDGLPKPIQVGNCFFKCELPNRNASYSFPDNVDAKRVLKPQYANTELLDYYPDVYTDADRAANTKLRNSNV